MSEPLTAKRFEQFVDAYTQNHGEIVQRLDTIETTLADHTARLITIENQGIDRRRIEKLERHLRQLAALTGHPELSHDELLPA